MSRLVLCGGLFLDAIAGALHIPGVSGLTGSSTSALLVTGSAVAVLAAAYKLVASHFGIVLTETPHFPVLQRLPLSDRSS